MAPVQSATSNSTSGHSTAEAGPHAGKHFWALTLGSIGVVYGDIGTSPLYAVRESVLAARGVSEAASAEIILGILSLIIWALILVVTVKYVLLLLRADNDGEGGTLALMALAQRALGGRSFLVLSLGIIGAALFYGDAMLTPAVSVLSAVEGLEIAAPGLQFYVVPLTVVILVACSRCSREAQPALPRSLVQSRSSGSWPSRSPGSGTFPKTSPCCRHSVQSTAYLF